MGINCTHWMLEEQHTVGVKINMVINVHVMGGREKARKIIKCKIKEIEK